MSVGLRGLTAVSLLLFSVSLGCARRGERGAAPAAERDEAPVTVHASVERYPAGKRAQDGDAKPITIGDRLLYSLEVTAAPGVELAPVDLGAHHGELPVLEHLEPLERKQGQSTVHTERWLLRADRVGSVTLPGVRVEYALAAGDGRAGAATSEAQSQATPARDQRPETDEREEAAGSEAAGGEASDSVTGEELTVKVASVLPEDVSSEDIRDVKPLAVPHRWSRLLLAAIVAALGLAVLAFWLLRRRSRARAQAAAEALPYDLVALRDLDRLKPTANLDPEVARQHAFEMSEVVRRYVEARFAFNATDRTTEEILSSLGTRLALATEDRLRLEGFLRDLDPVKYAGLPAARLLLERAYEGARAFVLSTRPSSGAPREGAPESARGARRSA